MDTINIIFNFIALSILASFDNFVYDSLKNESFKELVTRPFVEATLQIKHTTSKKCRPHEISDEIDEEGNPRPLRVMFEERPMSLKVLFVVYKAVRTFYVSVFYYFFPLSAVVISALLPVYYRERILPGPPNPVKIFQ